VRSGCRRNVRKDGEHSALKVAIDSSEQGFVETDSYHASGLTIAGHPIVWLAPVSQTLRLIIATGEDDTLAHSDL